MRWGVEAVIEGQWYFSALRRRDHPRWKTNKCRDRDTYDQGDIDGDTDIRRQIDRYRSNAQRDTENKNYTSIDRDWSKLTNANMPYFTDRERGSATQRNRERQRKTHTETKAETERAKHRYIKNDNVVQQSPFAIVLFNTAYASRRTRLRCLHACTRRTNVHLLYRYALPCTQLIGARLHGFGAVLESSMWVIVHVCECVQQPYESRHHTQLHLCTYVRTFTRIFIFNALLETYALFR